MFSIILVLGAVADVAAPEACAQYLGSARVRGANSRPGGFRALAGGTTTTIPTTSTTSSTSSSTSSSTTSSSTTTSTTSTTTTMPCQSGIIIRDDLPTIVHGTELRISCTKNPAWGENAYRVQVSWSQPTLETRGERNWTLNHVRYRNQRAGWHVPDYIGNDLGRNHLDIEAPFMLGETYEFNVKYDPNATSPYVVFPVNECNCAQ